MKRKNIDLPVLILNGTGIALLLYYGGVYLSHSTHITNPEAMLVMQDWEAAGILLTVGTVPLFVANLGAYLYLWKDTVRGPKRLLFFLPSLICLLLAAHYWIGGIRESLHSEGDVSALKAECLCTDEAEPGIPVFNKIRNTGRP